MAIDYSAYQQAVNPLQMAMAGYSQGAGIRQQREARAAKEAEAAQARQMQMDLAELARNPNRTAQDITSMMVKYPTMSEHFGSVLERMDSKQKESRISESTNILAAIKSGRADVAEGLLQDKLSAAEASGDKQAADGARVMLETLKTNPDAAASSMEMFLSAAIGPDKFAETYEKISGVAREAELQPGAIKKQAADLGLTDAQAAKIRKETDMLGIDAKKAALELEAMKDGKIPADPEKVFDQEQKLRKEYSTETKNFQDVQEAYRRIEAAQDSAAGDLSLIFSYMKMLDPGSVVREGEFATAQNAAGVPERVVNLYNNIINGERLNAGQRKSFRGQASSLFNASRKKEQEVRKGIERIVDSYGLNKDNVFLTESPEEAEVTATTEEIATAPEITDEQRSAVMSKYGL